MIDEPIVLHAPVAAVVKPHVADKRFDLFIKLFSWLTAAFLSAAIVVALVVGSVERDRLQDEVDGQSAIQLCRTLANEAVIEANRARDTTIAKALVAVANEDDAEVKRLIVILDRDTKLVNEAQEEQEKALAACGTG